jgi:serine/threonine protein kinase
MAPKVPDRGGRYIRDMSEAPPTAKAGPPPLATHSGDSLPPGTRLAEFEIRCVLGAGGFGIVYQAWDHALEREVALKEYMPVTLAGRGPGLRVTIRALAHEETFALGLRSFVNEARLLARFDHPSLLKVYRFWEDNGTAYMAMPMYHGRTLRQVRQQMAAGSPGEAWVRSLLDPMLGALECLHREGVYHRDIAPDNIMLADAGVPVLLDFGAARRVIGDRSHALTAILKPNFAPIEQYADVASMRQGPWTDLYGLAATAYYLLSGQPPLPAAARVLHDELVPLSRMNPAGCSDTFLEAIDWAMAVRPQERPQSVVVWRDVIEGRMAVPSRARHDTTQPGVTTLAVAGARGTDFDPTQVQVPASSLPRAAPPGSTPASDPRWRGFTVPGGVSTLQAAPPADAVETVPSALPDEAAPEPAMTDPATPRASAPMPTRSRRWALLGLGAAVVGTAAAFVWVVSSSRPAIAPQALAASASALAPRPPQPVEQILPAQTMQAQAPAASTPEPAPPAAKTAALAPAAVAPRSAAPANHERTRVRERDREREHERDSDGGKVANARLLGPRERCAEHNFVMRLFCIQRECDSDPRLARHPECVRMRKAEEERRERLQQGP